MKKLIAALLTAVIFMSSFNLINTYAEGYSTFYNLLFINDEFIDRMLKGGAPSDELEAFLDDIDTYVEGFQESIYMQDLDVFFISMFLQTLQKEEHISVLLSFDAMYQDEMLYMLENKKVPESLYNLMVISFGNKIIVSYDPPPVDVYEPDPVIPPEPDKEPEQKMPFDDIKAEDWYSASVCGLYELGVIQGRDDGKFHPNEYIRREEVLKMLIVLFLETNDVYEREFGKRAEGKWYHTYFSAAEYYALINGIYDENVFESGCFTTRQDMATICYRTAMRAKITLATNGTATDFFDISKFKFYAVEPIKMLQKAGIIKGVGNNMFAPDAFVTRAEAAEIVYYIFLQKNS